jgi:hypothetical protein
LADKHPYMSGSGGLVQAVNQLRKSFPAQVTADTLKKLSIAPNNETYVLNILRFIGVIDAAGKKTPKAGTVFNLHTDPDFQKGFAEMVEAAYSELFGLHSKDAWILSTDKLISFFRQTDSTSAIVGQRQAGTFQALAGLSGHAAAVTKAVSAPRRAEGKRVSAPTKVRPAPKDDSGGSQVVPPVPPQRESRDVGLTVRVEINLPVAPDQATYDRIFKSIRENLLGGE